MMGKVYVYNLDIMKYAQLKRVLTNMGIECEIVEKKNQNLKISQILNGHISQGNCANPFLEEMMLMCVENQQQLDAMLAALRENGIRIPLKAVLTQTNMNWNSLKLYEELKKEQKFFANR